MSPQHGNPAASNAATQLLPRSQLPLHLLRLPREILNKVYDEVFKSQKPFQLHLCGEHDRFHRYGPVTSFEISYTQPDGLLEEEDLAQTRPRGLRWMLTNKQICKEAVEQFQLKATWTLIEEASPFSVHTRGELGRWSSPNHVLSFQPCLLMPIAARHIVVQNGVELDIAELNFHAQPILEVRIVADSSLSLLIKELRGSTSLLTLSIYVETTRHGDDFEKDSDRYSIKIKLDPLTDLDMPCLKKLEVDVTWQDLDEAHADVILAFEESLDDLGTTLVGCERAMTHLVDEDSPQNSLYTYTRG